ncbi:At2g23090 like protein [Blastocladiella britannica]|nr:At2g23090 like protein [Blastocladiella britannica]
MGNGSKAQMKRDRNAKAAAGGPKSQLKSNEAAKSIQCMTCRQTFLGTASDASLTEHAENRHSKTLKDCFPTKA